MFTKYSRWRKIGIKIIYTLFLVPAKMGKDDYSLSLSLITTKNSEQKTKKSYYLTTLKSTQSRWIGNVSEKSETNHKV